MKNLSDLSRRDLEKIVRHVVTVLYAEEEDDLTCFNRDKEWSSNELPLIAEILEKYDLIPPETEHGEEAQKVMLAWHESMKPPVNRSMVEKQLAGALKDSIHSHGPITQANLASAAKRMIGVLKGIGVQMK